MASLKLYNSLSRAKDDFKPLEGRKVKWYMCGPTVYDVAHMGHARSYMSFDIVRRVLADYFGYNIVYAMNITDIDDKIIVRARRNFLVEQYVEQKPSTAQLISDVSDALAPFTTKVEKETDNDKRAMLQRLLTEATTSLEALKKAVENGSANEAMCDALVTRARDPLGAWLDFHKGGSVTDHSIFAKLTQHVERLFHADMQALNILPADFLTRVSEYVPEVVEFIQRIIANEFAYEADGSVYFDVKKFDEDPNHTYAKLVPEAVGDRAALAEGEGELSAATGKRSDRDFALWKSSKPGEPSWDSPWGQGRPGWHIECSVMCSDILGEKVDIHSGGVDLKFPHHDNEIAQSEACFGHDSWIQYFLHAGHLTIEGCKMSKSLKNFITIQEALSRYSSRQLRLAFLTHSWQATLDYSENVMSEAKQLESFFDNFFHYVRDLMQRQSAEVRWCVPKPTAAEKELHEKFIEKQSAIHDALCDSINTAAAMQILREIVSLVNVYTQNAKAAVDSQLIKKIETYVSKILATFGLPEPKDDVSQAGKSVVYALSDFRDTVRATAREAKQVGLLEACDALRNDILPELGISLEDRPDGPALVKFVDKEVLLEERRKELELLEEKRRKKAEAQRKAQELQAAKDAKKRIPPSEMFRKDPKFTQFDEQGVPTHERDEKGEEKPVSGKQKKKLQKLYDAQAAIYQPES
ncbi:cysteine--tRNA ligase, cytoplasmic-like [Sycon ciliatum]|uniref:cysteine--tRNA ligase, cytoplasmic-like n=1 Tax=Sycon ciliatum TaxID=27933 RepID=UPI0020AC601B|eukprot:scpid46293/ scgid6880/ Cysteine--tRNA ligase, cytoplasmic; Cysteinyl-tRNA synthetase